MFSQATLAPRTSGTVWSRSGALFPFWPAELLEDVSDVKPLDLLAFLDDSVARRKRRAKDQQVVRTLADDVAIVAAPASRHEIRVDDQAVRYVQRNDGHEYDEESPQEQAIPERSRCSQNVSRRVVPNGNEHHGN